MCKCFGGVKHPLLIFICHSFFYFGSWVNLKVLTWILSSFPLKLSVNLKPKTVSNFQACVGGGISRPNAFVLTGGEAVKASGETVRGLVKSRVEFHSRLRRSRISSCAKEYGGPANAPLLTNPASYAGYKLPAFLELTTVTPRVLFLTTI